MRSYHVLYLVGFLSYAVSVGLLGLGIMSFVVGTQSPMVNQFGYSQTQMLNPIAAGTGITFITIAISAFVSGALMIAFADLVRSNMQIAQQQMQLDYERYS